MAVSVHPDFFPEYAGLSYRDASLRGHALIEKALQTGYWFDLPERLAQLRERMQALSGRPPAAEAGPSLLRSPEYMGR